MSLVILFHFLCAQHVSDINISIIRSLRLSCGITTSVVLFLVRCVLEFRCGWVGVVIPQDSRKLLMMDILMSETCWAHKKWNKITSDIKLVFYSSTVTMMYGPINIQLVICLYSWRQFHINKSIVRRIFDINLTYPTHPLIACPLYNILPNTGHGICCLKHLN